jgi:hypothetical protein
MMNSKRFALGPQRRMTIPIISYKRNERVNLMSESLQIGNSEAPSLQ